MSKWMTFSVGLAFRLLLRNADSIATLECEVEGVKAGYCNQGNSWKRLMSLLMQLRKVVDHPFLMPNSEARGDGTSSLEELVEASGECVSEWTPGISPA
jgi:hypothetical protein